MKQRRKSTWQKCRVCLDWARRDRVKDGICSRCEQDWLRRG
jgi:hypothetical protein